MSYRCPLRQSVATGGEISHEDGWCFAPPIFSFSRQKKKRKRAVHGPKEKKKYGGYDTGARLNDWRETGMTSHAA